MPADEMFDPAELSAYVDDQLDVTRKIAVEHWLSQNPQAAAIVMADLRLRDELRLVNARDRVEASPATEALAQRLGGRLQNDGIFRRMRPLLAASVLLTIGWIAHGEVGNTAVQASTAVPEYVTAAVEAHHITEMRAQMHSQPRTTDYDPAELLANTEITLPPLPAGWAITDIQVYPSEFGPSVEVAVDAGDVGAVSLFAARPGHFLIRPPMTRPVEDTTTAYWQLGDTAYALVATAPSRDISSAATTLFRSMR